MAGDSRRDELAELLDEQANLPSYDAEKFLKDFEAEIYEFAAIVSETIASTNVRRYPWIDPNDLQQELLMRVRHFSINFDPTKVTKKKPSWAKNLWFRLAFYVKDVLRKEDPVGIRYPQRERYPQWFRLGELDGTQEGEDQSPNGTDFDGSELTEVDAAITAEAIEQRQWQADFDAVGRLAEEIQVDNRIPSMVDCGQGVCRSTTLEWWCKRKGRLKFRGKSLLTWIRTRKPSGSQKGLSSAIKRLLELAGHPGHTRFELAQLIGCESSSALSSCICRLIKTGDVIELEEKRPSKGSRGNVLVLPCWVEGRLEKPKNCQAHHQKTLNKESNLMSEPMANTPPATNPVDNNIHPSAALVINALQKAGSVGANMLALISATGLSRASVQALILRLRRKGEVYVVAIMGAGKREQYALSTFFPDGPPITQIYRTNPKKTKPKPKPKTKAAVPTKKPIPKPDQTDIMLIVTALAGVRNAGLKARLLAVLEESMKG